MTSWYEFGPFRLDPERLLLLHGDSPVALGPKVVETLLALLEQPGEVITKHALIERVWPEGYVDEASLAQNIYVLRKLLRARWDVVAIETIPRRGYRFVAPVAQCHAPAPVASVANAVVSTNPPAPIARPRFAWIAIAAVLCISLAGAALALTRTTHTPLQLSADGARLYQIGRYNWNLRTPDGIARSIAYFTEVIRTDPRDAHGYAALASAYAVASDAESTSAMRHSYVAAARTNAQRALALDPNCGEAYAVLGIVSMDEGTDIASVTRAADRLRRAVELDPSDAPAHEWYGIALLALNDVDDSYAQLEQAADLEPLSVASTAWLSQAAYLDRRYDKAIALAHETLDLSPRRNDAWVTMGLAYEARGEFSRAADAFRRYGQTSKNSAEAAALIAAVDARAHRSESARMQLSIAQQHVTQVDPEDLAIAFALLGQRRVALSWLRRTHDAALLRVEIANDPRFAPFRSGDAISAEPVQKPA
jgi:DNA-binding winged helix-turn-helix (wHTH) protein/Tfp pilus assembly protein PilF